MMHFHERLKHIRKIHGYTQQFVAEKVDSSQSSYGKYEKAVYEPNLSFIQKVLQVYDIYPEWLLFGNGEMLKPNMIKDDPLNRVIDAGGKDIANISLSAIFIISYDDLEAAVSDCKIDIYKGRYPVCISVLLSRYLDYQKNLSEIKEIKNTPILLIETTWSAQYVVLKKFLESNGIDYTLG